MTKDDPVVLSGAEPQSDAVPEKAKRAKKPKVYAVEQNRHPYTPLGYDHGTFYYLSHAARQVIALSTSAHTINNLLQLADLNYWESMYPNGGKVPVDKAANYLFAKCYAKGIYDPAKIRGRGAWWDDGRSVMHAGDRLIVDGKWTEIPAFQTKYLYEASKPIDIDVGNPLTVSEATKFGVFLGKLSWAEPTAARLAAGWCVCALIAGALQWHPHLWIVAKAGSGKAQPHSAKVLTKNGWRKMGDLRVGDLVTTPDNGHGTIKAIYPQGTVPVFNITFSDGRTTRATADHLWKVRSSGFWRLKTTSELIEILAADNRRSVSLAVPLAEPLDIEKHIPTTLAIHPYVLGAFLGDGHLGYDYGNSHQGRIGLTSYDPHIVEMVRGLLPDDVGLFDTNTDKEFRLGDLSKYGRKTRKMIKYLRLLGTRSHTKFIPGHYLKATISERWELLQGLMDTDGTVGIDGGTAFCTTSEQLSKDVEYLVRSLGGIAYTSLRHPSYTYLGEKKQGKTAYIVNIRVKDRFKLFTLPRKLERLQQPYQYEDFLYLNVESITADGVEESSCISIDHPDRLYVTDDFVVTHNSWTMDKVISEVLLGFAQEFKSSVTTEPGIRRSLMGSSLPVMLDDPDGASQMQKIIELMRACSQSGRAKAAQGGGEGGGAVHFELLSCFICSSVIVPFTNEADIGRITVLSLDNSHLTQQEQEDNFTQLKIDRAALLTEEYCNRFQARAVAMIPIIRASIEPMVIAASRVLGNRRGGDQIGTLLAGAWSLRSDKPPTLQQAIDWIAEKDLGVEIEARRESDELVCMRTIAQSVLSMDHGIKRRVDELVRAAIAPAPADGIALTEEEQATESYRKAALSTLRRHGILPQADHVSVSNTDDAVKRMLRGTAWEKNWANTLQRISGAEKRNPTWFNSGRGMSPVRCVAIPVGTFLGEISLEPGED